MHTSSGLSDSNEDYSIDEKEFGYDDKYMKNFGSSSPRRSRSPSPRSSSPVIMRIPQNSLYPMESLSTKSNNTRNKTMSYKDTMKLIDDIFICNYWDKKRGNATLINGDQISKWIDHFKNVNFEMPTTKRLNSYHYDDERKVNIYNIPITIKNGYSIIDEILLLGKGKISLCGGALISLIDDGINNNGDWDLFFHCETVSEADDLLNSCLKLLENKKPFNNVSHYKNQRVHTVDYGRIKIQFIKRIYKSKDQVLLGFDLAPCRIGYNHVDGLFATICGGLSIAMKHFPLDTTQRSMSFGYRLSKYINKGFNVMYPGLPPNFNGFIKTPDGQLEGRNDILRFHNKSTIESDYEGNEGDHMNWFYILSEKYHLLTFEGDIDEITELSNDFVRNSIISNRIFEVNSGCIDTLNVKTNKLFLGEKYKEFITAVVIEEDDNKGCQIWRERVEWYVQKGIEIAKSLKENYWKTKNPGDQSFGKFNPILEHPKMWYGDNYQSVEAGIKTARYVTLVSCLKNIFPEDIIHVICDQWLEAEVNLARNHLFSLDNSIDNSVSSKQSYTRTRIPLPK